MIWTFFELWNSVALRHYKSGTGRGAYRVWASLTVPAPGWVPSVLPKRWFGSGVDRRWDYLYVMSQINGVIQALGARAHRLLSDVPALHNGKNDNVTLSRFYEYTDPQA